MYQGAPREGIFGIKARSGGKVTDGSPGENGRKKTDGSSSNLSWLLWFYWDHCQTDDELFVLPNMYDKLVVLAFQVG